jgi:hypothetical protein
MGGKTAPLSIRRPGAAAAELDRATIAGHYGTTSYKAWGKDRLGRYDRKLKAIARTSRVITRKLYTED